MSTLLITGASGFIGKALSESLAARHQVLCLSRHDPKVPGTRWVRGEFSSFEDLRALDTTQVQALVHLGAVTGGCLERDGMLVNVEGTRVLMRYLIDHGCRKFVMASSIAAMGIQHVSIRPKRVPIPDDHPCLDRDGYGFSKYLMEEVTRYYHRQSGGIDVCNLRLSTVLPDEARPGDPGPLRSWALGSITAMVRSDAVKLFTLAAEQAHKSGVRVMNACCARAWSTAPTAEVMAGWWASDVDLSYYRKPGHEYESAYDVSALRADLGFEAGQTLEILGGTR